MKYKSYETPLYSAVISFYNHDYSNDIPKKVLQVLKNYGLFPPHSFYADSLTHDNYECCTNHTEELFIKAYSEKSVDQVSMIGYDVEENSIEMADEYWRFHWVYSVDKNNDTAGSMFKHWNSLTIKSTHGRLNSMVLHNNFIQCIKDLIQVLDPIFVRIDDIANSVELTTERTSRFLGHYHVEGFRPGVCKAIYWGNYFNKKYYNVNEGDLKALPIKNVQEYENGIFFTLTDHVCDYDSKETRKMRRLIMRLIKSGQGDGLREP